MLNVAVIMGRLVGDPELRTTQSGISVTSFRVAVERDYQPKDSTEKQVDWIDVVAWRNTAEFVCNYFKKGDMIVVQGSIQTRTYTDRNDNKRTAVEILADRVYFGQAKQSNQGTSQPKSPQTSFNSGDDFDEVLDDGDLPF